MVEEDIKGQIEIQLSTSAHQRSSSENIWNANPKLLLTQMKRFAKIVI